jgi:two-component system sensor histidine kinase UhpB
MERALRILILEDLPTDAELMAYELRQAAIAHSYRRVASREHFVTALGEGWPDLILSDFHLPGFDGLEALALAQATCPDTPFLFVSGAMGEEVAIEALKQGATDYVLKDRLSRLGPAVLRALRETEERRERRQAMAALRESEEKYRLLVKNLPAVVYKGYVDCSVDFVDRKVEELVGYQKEEFDSRHLKWHEVLIPEDRQKFKEAFLAGLKTSRSYVREYRVRRVDDQVIWIQDRGQIICDPDGRVEYVSGVFFDITLRQRAEEALRESEQRLRFLTSQLLSAQERERKRISMELHDELGQSLALLKLQIRAIERGLGEDQQNLKSGCRELLSYLDGVIDDVRRLSRDLSPAVLEDLGLQSALKHLISGVSKHYAVSHTFEAADLDHLFPSDAQIIIYRIFQECLTNISKHAEATEVLITLKEYDGFISLVLEDNGAGFDTAQVSARRALGGGLGLAALDERARMLGGTLEIWSQPGAGTRVTCVIPINQGGRAPGN